jgi:hypothetical protein
VDGDTYYAEAVINVEESSESGSISGSVDLTDDENDPDSVNIDMDGNESATVKVYLPDDYEGSDVEDIYWYTDDDDMVIDNVVQEDYDDEDYYVKFTIESSYNEGDATIHFEFDIDSETYYADVNLDVASGSGTSGSVDLEDDEDDQDTLSIDMNTNDSATIKVNLPDDYLGSDVSGLVWDIDDDDHVINDFNKEGYADEDDFINFRVESSDEEGDATIDLIIDLNGVSYYAEVEINVNE